MLAVLFVIRLKMTISNCFLSIKRFCRISTQPSVLFFFLFQAAQRAFFFDLFLLLLCAAGPAMTLDLSRVFSFEKQRALFNVLHSKSPDHYSRLWMAGFLKHVGYTLSDICFIIDEEASWDNYDVRKTYCQVNSLFRRSGHSGNPTKGISSPRGAWLKHSEWIKKYGKRLCTIHYVRCADCPDNQGSGKPCRGRI